MRLAVVGLDSLDPAQIVPTNQADMIAVDLLDEGLTSIDPVHNVAVPALATHWSTDGSGSSATTGGTTPSATVGRTWTFDLDPHAEFSDGSAVTAADVVTSLTTVAALGNTTLAGARLDVVEGYTDLVTHQLDVAVGAASRWRQGRDHHRRTRCRAAAAAGLARLRRHQAGSVRVDDHHGRGRPRR